MRKTDALREVEARAGGLACRGWYRGFVGASAARLARVLAFQLGVGDYDDRWMTVRSQVKQTK